MNSARRVNEIDLLRFLAALAVVFYHYTFRGYAADGQSIMPYPLLAPVSKYAYLGVQLFFMISGFAILMTASSGSLKHFVISRVTRLYPTFWICSTVTFLLILVIGGTQFSASISQYLMNLTMLNELFDVPYIDGAYWSMLVEIKFYLLIGIVLALGRIHQAQFFLVFWLAIALFFEMSHIGKLRDFFLVDFAPYFIAGATYYLIWLEGISLARVGIIAVCWALALFHSINHLADFELHYHTQMSAYAVAGIITAIYGVMMMISLRRTGYFGRHRWVVLGAVTYPLYLLHQRIGFMIFNADYPAINPHVLLWGTVIGMIAFAYLVDYCVEKWFSPKVKNALQNFSNIFEREKARPTQAN